MCETLNYPDQVQDTLSVSASSIYPGILVSGDCLEEIKDTINKVFLFQTKHFTVSVFEEPIFLDPFSKE